MPEHKQQRQLTYKERLFVEAYLGSAHGNASLAAQMAGYSTPIQAVPDLTEEEIAKLELKAGWSLRKQASLLLRKPIIRAAIDEALAVYAMTAAEVLSELAKVARIPATSGPRDVKNKVAALAHLAKYHGLLTDRLDITTKGQALNFATLAKLADERTESSTDDPQS